MSTVAAYAHELAATVRDIGAQSALDFDPSWTKAAEEAIEQLAATGRPFSSDDVRWTCGDPPSPNALGAVILAASKREAIVPAGWTTSRRIIAHSRAVRLWQGASL